MRRSIRRRIKRLLQKPKFLKRKREIIKFQKFSVICFIGNSLTISDGKPKLAELFQTAVSLANKYFQKFLNWILSLSFKVSVHLLALLKNLFKNHASFILFGVTISLALLFFRQQIMQMNNSIMSWLKKKFKWPVMGCSVIVILAIYFLLIAVTDLPPLPATKIIRYFISKVSAIFQSYSKLSPEKPVIMTNEPKYNGERSKLIFLSVITILFFRYLLGQYKRKLFEDIPFGEILIEMYDNDMKDCPDSFIPISK